MATVLARPIERPGKRGQLALIILCLLVSGLLGAAAAFTGGWLLVGALSVLALGLVLLAWPELATMAFVALLYLNIPVLATQFYGVPYLIAGAFVLLLTVPIIGNVLERRPFVFTPGLPLLLAYLGALLLSALFAPRPVTEDIVVFLIEGLLIYLLTTQAIRSVVTLRRALWVLILAGAVMGAVSLHQEITGSYSSNYGGFAQIESREFTNVGDPTLVSLLSLNLEEDGRERLAGPIGEKNRYAQILLLTVPLAIFAFLGSRQPRVKLVAAGAVLFALAGIVLTFSRGAAVALFGVLLIIAILQRVRLSHIVLAGVALAAAVLVVAPDYLLRLESLSGIGGLLFEEGVDPDGAILGRATENLAALYAFLDHPLFGVGPGQFATTFVAEYGNPLGLRQIAAGRESHNLYLGIAADTGIIGLTAFMAIAIVTLIGLWRARQYWLSRRPEYANLASALFVSGLAYGATGLFLHLSYERYLWFMLALANSAIWILRQERIAWEATEAPRPATTPKPRLERRAAVA